MYKRTILVLFLVLFASVSTSCWDQIEIERQGFIIGVAIDKAEEPDKIEVTFQIAHPEAFVDEAQSENLHWNVSKIGKDISETTKSLARGLPLQPTFEHCQVILIGEDMTREYMDRYIDFVMRTHEVRRRLQLGVVQGKAKDILDMDFKSDMIPSFLVSEIMNRNTRDSYYMTDYMYIGNLHTAYVEGYDFIMSRIIPREEELEMTGGAVFKDFQLVGWLSGEEMMGARFLRGDVSSGSMIAELPSDFGDRMVLKVFEASSNLKPEVRGSKIIAVLDVKIEGDINEIVNPSQKINSIEFVNTAKSIFQEHLRKVIAHSFTYTQQELESDPFRIKEKLQSYYPSFWSDNKDKWDEIYNTVELETNIEVRIRRIGETKE